jgi:uncharacterized protein YggU (UPF0235/DUF167 family)
VTDLAGLAQPGATFAVSVTPGARRARIKLVDGVVRISVSAPPEAGRATEAARAALEKGPGRGADPADPDAQGQGP